MRRASLDALMQIAAHRFEDQSLLEQAITHPSASSRSRPDNQRLEFLGDRVLGLIISEALLAAFPSAPEGDLAPRFNALVRRETLADVATEIDLGSFLMLGRSENISGGRRKAAILADAMEAVIAALYLDGGLDAAKAFVLLHWKNRLTEVKAKPTDAKTQVQEWAQARGQTPPDYRLLDRSGPDHAPVFSVEASLQSGQSARGQAKTKKLAEQLAAAALLQAVEKND